MREFNVTGLCVKDKHYMVDVSDKIAKIKVLIDKGCYFTINRARQYGKTTTISLITKELSSEYVCARMSFEGVGETMFKDVPSFCQRFLWQISNTLSDDTWEDKTIVDFDLLGSFITKKCKDKKIVLLIDEVDRTSNNQVFLHFLGMLRDKYLLRNEFLDYTFHAVILSGVYDVKNIKLKMINEGTYNLQPTEGKIYNSPWNIATKFNVDMSFNPREISTMLIDYEKDHNTGMNIQEMSQEIYDYTSGYPFMVSWICKSIDEELDKSWTVDGVQEAVKIFLEEKNTLFDDLFKNLENNSSLYNLIYDILIVGQQRTFVIGNPTIDLGHMYGILKSENKKVVISNKIFEILISNYLISKEEEKSNQGDVLQRDIVKNGVFDMELCLTKFAQHYNELFNKNDVEFLERHGRLLFLSYLKPLINGKGFYHIESQFTDLRRMDIVVDYDKQQFIIELKRWKGENSREEAMEQLAGYMESKGVKDGYLLTFDFTKNKAGQKEPKWVEVQGKRIFDVVV